MSRSDRLILVTLARALRRGTAGAADTYSPGRGLPAGPALERPLMSSWEIETRVKPTAEKVRQVVRDCGWHSAVERWGWLGERTLSRIVEREQQGLPAAGRQGRKRTS